MIEFEFIVIRDAEGRKERKIESVAGRRACVVACCMLGSAPITLDTSFPSCLFYTPIFVLCPLLHQHQHRFLIDLSAKSNSGNAASQLCIRENTQTLHHLLSSSVTTSSLHSIFVLHSKHHHLHFLITLPVTNNRVNTGDEYDITHRLHHLQSSSVITSSLLPIFVLHHNYHHLHPLITLRPQ